MDLEVVQRGAREVDFEGGAIVDAKVLRQDHGDFGVREGAVSDAASAEFFDQIEPNREAACARCRN